MIGSQGKVVRLSEDLMGPLEKARAERCDKNIAATTRALLRQVLISRGFYDVEPPQSEKDGPEVA